MGEILYFWKFLDIIMRFTGTIDAKLDAKGRVFLPSDYRRQLLESDSRLVLKRDIYQPCLVVYPHEVWDEEVNALRSRLNRWNPKHAMLFRQFMADVEVFKLDANGRFLIPKRLLQSCDIDHAVSFVGVDDRIEIWSAERTEQPFLSPEAYAATMEELMGKDDVPSDFPAGL